MPLHAGYALSSQRCEMRYLQTRILFASIPTTSTQSKTNRFKLFQLSPDESFHFELLRPLALARYHGVDINKVLTATSKIIPRDFESFYSVFHILATRKLTRADSLDSKKYPVSAQDAYLAASTCFRCADFFLHGNQSDPRIDSLWKRQTYAFDKAIALLPIPGQRVSLKADGFTVPGIFYAAQGEGKKPTLIIWNGFDGAQEEMLHCNGFAALESGWNVITYEGPGQCSVVRDQGLGFMAEWEKVVTPVFDYLETRKEADMLKLGLIGFSMAGMLCVRAVAFEHRIAKVIAIDGVHDVGEALDRIAGPLAKSIEEGADGDVMVKFMLADLKVSAKARWGIGHGLWAFQTDSAAEFLARGKKMTLEGFEDKIECLVWIGLAEDDIFFEGQPEKVKEALGNKATLARLTDDDGAEQYCHSGAFAFLNQQVMDWFQDVTENR